MVDPDTVDRSANMVDRRADTAARASPAWVTVPASPVVQAAAWETADRVEAAFPAADRGRRAARDRSEHLVAAPDKQAGPDKRAVRDRPVGRARRAGRRDTAAPGTEVFARDRQAGTLAAGLDRLVARHRRAPRPSEADSRWYCRW